MFLDLASTVVGGVLVLVGEGVLLALVMLWALMGAGKKADEQKERCMYLSDLQCTERCPEWISSFECKRDNKECHEWEG